MTLLHKIDEFYTAAKHLLSPSWKLLSEVNHSSGRRSRNWKSTSRYSTSSRRLISTSNLSDAQTSVSRIHDVFAEDSPGTLKYSRPVYNEIGKTGEWWIPGEKSRATLGMENSNTCREPIYPKGERKNEPAEKNATWKDIASSLTLATEGQTLTVAKKKNQRLQFFFCPRRSKSFLTRNSGPINVRMQ